MPLSIRYGYRRFDAPVMVAVTVVLIGLVALIQFGGDGSPTADRRRTVALAKENRQ